MPLPDDAGSGAVGNCRVLMLGEALHGTAEFYEARAVIVPISRLIARVCDWNRDGEPADQVGFHGLDMYNLSTSIRAVLSHLESTDSKTAAVARHLEPWTEQPAAYGRITGFEIWQVREAVFPAIP